MVAKQTLAGQVADHIRTMIIEQELQPGDRLPTEQAIADELNVSRVSVREATKALGFVGILDASPRRGLTVGNVDMDRLCGMLAFHLSLSRYPARTIVQARMVIEIGALPFTMEAVVHEPGRYESLRKLALKTEEFESPEAFIDAEIAYHRALVEASGIEPLVPVADLLHEFFRRFFEAVVGHRYEGGIRHHAQLADLLREQRIVEAENLLRRHLSRFLDDEPDGRQRSAKR